MFGGEIEHLGGRRGLGEGVVWEGVPVGEELVESAGLDDGAGDDVRAGFAALFEDDDADVVSALALELLETDGGAETGGPGADDADVYVVLCALDIVWVEEGAVGGGVEGPGGLGEASEWAEHESWRPACLSYSAPP